MFESLKHWLEEAHAQSRLFEHADDELLHVALASLLYRVISTDTVETAAEKREFSQILKHEFDLSDAQVAALHERVQSISCSLEDDLATIASHLKDKPTVRLNFMKMLSQMIAVSGVNEREMQLFYEAQQTLFPEIQQDPF